MQKEPRWTSPQALNLDSWHTVVAGVPLSLFLMVKADHSALAKTVCPNPFLRDSVAVPQGLPLMDGDHSALAKRICPNPFLRDSVGVPQGLPLMDGDHSALAKRVCPNPFLRDSVGVPQGLPLMDGADHSALAKRVCSNPFLRDSVGVPQGLPLMDGAVAKGVGSSHFCRNVGGVPQSPSHGCRMLLNPQGAVRVTLPRTTIDRSLRQPPEKSMRAERDPPNAAEAMSTHAHSNKLRKEDFPMPEKKFQKRVLQLLLEIKNTIHVATSSAGTSYEVKPANTEEELEALENRLEDKNEGAELSKHLKRLGGVDAADLVKKSMAATMTNKMMAKMSLRGRSGKVAFMKTHLYKTICDAVFSSFNTTTTKVEEYMSKYLKYAPERMGGGGRKK